MVGVFPSEVKPGLLQQAKSGDVKGLEATIASGVKLGHQLTSDKRNAYHVAAEAGKRDILKALYKHFPSSIDRQDADGRTPLHLACYFGRPREVKWLIQNKAAIVVTDVDGNHPIHMASLCKSGTGAFQVVDLLLKMSSKDLTTLRNNAGDVPKDIAKTVDAIKAFDAIKLVSKRV